MDLVMPYNNRLGLMCFLNEKNVIILDNQRRYLVILFKRESLTHL